MSNHSFSPVNDSKFDNLNSEQTHVQDNNSNGTFENLDPELEQFECMQKINVEYSIHLPANGRIQTTSTQYGQKTNAIQPCIHFCNKGACYKAELPLNAVCWNQFNFLLYESTNNVYITGYISNDPELQKNQQFVLKDKDYFGKWMISVAEHPKAEIRIDLVCSMESKTSDSISGLSLSQCSIMVGNTTKERIKALMDQLVKEYPINNKYSKESSVYINTENPKEYIHITYEMR
ncbi:hypothetical protein BY996DRAFT_6421115 [Phakopsora pachyrhizi]|nr:hypothetical protein BY996DRAFT_6421115 [Phakopsora pachyrhizi]